MYVCATPTPVRSSDVPAKIYIYNYIDLNALTQAYTIHILIHINIYHIQIPVRREHMPQRTILDLHLNIVPHSTENVILINHLDEFRIRILYAYAESNRVFII